MKNPRISREALLEVEKALAEYAELLAERRQAGQLAENTESTYLEHSTNFVRWLRGEFDPGTRART